MARGTADRPYSQREVRNHLVARLTATAHTWIDDPGGARDTLAYGSRFLPSQLVYVIYKPSTLDLRILFTPSRISLSREAELWEAAEACRLALRREKVSARRRTGNTEETERDEQFAITIPAEGMTDAAFDAFDVFLTRVALCIGIEEPEEG